MPPARPNETATPPADRSDRLRKHVEALASEIGERHVWRPDALEAAARYIEDRLPAQAGRLSRQPYQAEGRAVHNIEWEIRGHACPDRILVIGAHYDSRCGMRSTRSTVHRPGTPGTPGANDNASAIAVLLELAAALAARPWPLTVRLIAFTNEEHPFFQTRLMGSRVYARACRERGDRLHGMISLDDLGFYSDRPGSQKRYFPYNLAIPSTGAFLAFLANWHSRRFLQHTLAAFRSGTDFPARGCVVPAVIPWIGWSDDWAFWQEGYPAICLTDTAFLRYPHYHTADDTPDKLDYRKMAAITDGLIAAMPRLLQGL